MNNLYPLSGNAIPDAMATDAEVSSAIASHLASTNPHQITPTLIGAAAASHTHTGAQITGNISGNAANVTGVVAIANGGTNATNAPTARTNLGITPANIGAANAAHTHYYSDIVDKTARWMYQDPTFGSGWSAHGYGYTFSMRELAGTLVAINGLVQRTATNNQIIFSFHPMYAPPTRKLFIVIGWINNAYTPCCVEVTPDGQILLVAPYNTNAIVWLSLDGLIWFNKQ